jgi:hypothetical protein
MSSLRAQFAVGLQLFTFIIIWSILILVNEIPLRIDWDAIKLLPSVVSIYAILYLLFIKWLWRLSIFKNWLVIISDLQGTWKGEISTTWKYPETGSSLAPIQAYLVIRQTLRNAYITMYTVESVSHSDAAAVYIDEDRGIKLLSYSYSNVPRADVRDGSAIHYGSARLRIIKAPRFHLEGDYWTDRKSMGHMKFEFLQRRLVDEFLGSARLAEEKKE